jgi:hypothetical protein
MTFQVGEICYLEVKNNVICSSSTLRGNEDLQPFEIIHKLDSDELNYIILISDPTISSWEVSDYEIKEYGVPDKYLGSSAYFVSECAMRKYPFKDKCFQCEN